MDKTDYLYHKDIRPRCLLSLVINDYQSKVSGFILIFLILFNFAPRLPWKTMKACQSTTSQNIRMFGICSKHGLFQTGAWSGKPQLQGQGQSQRQDLQGHQTVKVKIIQVGKMTSSWDSLSLCCNIQTKISPPKRMP